jgi:hypothetical protein
MRPTLYQNSHTKIEPFMTAAVSLSPHSPVESRVIDALESQKNCRGKPVLPAALHIGVEEASVKLIPEKKRGPQECRQSVSSA